MVLLGVDIGTSSLKLGAVDPTDGTFLGWSQSGYDLLDPQPGLAEMEGQRYFDAFCDAVSSLARNVDLSGVKALCVSGQGQTFVPVDRAGRCLQNAWTWLDSRANAEARDLTSRFASDVLFRHVGSDDVSPGSFAAMVKYLRDRQGDVYRRTWKLLHVSSYLIYRLTGRAVWDANSAAMACMYDWQARKWWQPMLQAVGVDAAMLPDVVDSGTVVGEVQPDVGVPSGTLVVSGANDQTANAVGAGLDNDEKMLVVLGTALIGYKVFTAGGLPDANGYHGICSVYPMPPASYQLGYTNSGCATFDWCKRLVADPVSYDDAFEHIRAVPPGSDGVTCLIDLDGRAWPANSNYRGVFAGLSRKTDRWTMLRSVAEGIACSTRELIELLNWELGGKVVRVVGGAVRSDVWVQILADVMNVPLERLGHEQSGVAGSAIMAGVASGLFTDYRSAGRRVVKIADRFDPDPARQAEYEKLYRRFRALRTSAAEYYKPSK